MWWSAVLHPPTEERVAEWSSLSQIMSYSNLRYETPLTESKWLSSSRNTRTIGTIPLIMATNITLSSFLSFFRGHFDDFHLPTPSFFSIRFLMEAKKLIVSRNDSIDNSFFKETSPPESLLLFFLVLFFLVYGTSLIETIKSSCELDQISPLFY